MKTRSKGLLTAFLIVALAIISVFAITPFTATADFIPSADFLTLSNAVEFAETGEPGFVRVNLFSNGKIQRIPTVYRTDTLDLEFDGWYTQKNGAGTKADDNTIVDTYQIFYDHWVAREIEESKKIKSVNIPVASFINGQTVLEWYNTCGLTTVEGIQSISGYEIYNDLNAYGEKLADDAVIDVNKDYSVVTNLRLESGYYFDYGMSVTASNGIRAGVTYYNTEVNTNYWNSVATDLRVTINFPAEIGSDSFGFTTEPESASLSEGDSYDYSFTLKGEPQSAELQLKNGENWIKIDDVDLLTSSGTITPRTGANVFRIFVNYASGSLYSNEFTVTWINPNDNEFTLQPVSGSIKNGLDYNYTWACLHTPYSANLQRKDGEDWTDLGAVNGVVSYLDSYADTTQTFRISAIYGENQFTSDEFTVEYKSTPLFSQQPMGQKVAIGSSYVVRYAVEKESYQEFSSSNSLLQVKNGDTWELASATDIYLTEAVVPAQNTETTKVYRVGLRIGSTTLYSDEFTVTWVNDYTFDLDNDNLAWGEVAKADGYVEYEKIIKLMPTGTVFNNGTLMVSEPVNFGVYTWKSPFGYYLITYTPNSDLSAGEYTETVYVWSTSDGSDELCKTAVTLSITIVDAPSEFIVAYGPGEGNGSTDFDYVDGGTTITLLNPADLDFTAQEGMTFSHWKVCKDNASDPNFVEKQPGDEITITFETYIIAVWEELPTFFVVYAPGEGNGSNDLDSIYEGATITLLAPADLDFTAQEGMTFSHWKVCKDNASDPNFVEKQPGDEITITFETYIIAVWEELPTFIVAYGPGEGNGSTDFDYVVEGTTITLLNPADLDFTAQDGMTFSHWKVCKDNASDPNFVVKQPGDEITITFETYIIAVWKEGMTYDVSFSANGGTGEMATVNDVSSYVLPENGFTAPSLKYFKAWAIGSIEGVQKQPGETITLDADTTIYAIWADYTIINSVHLSGGATPVPGANPDLSFTVETEGIAGFATLQWCSASPVYLLQPTYTYVAGKEYYLNVKFEVEKGYKLAPHPSNPNSFSITMTYDLPFTSMTITGTGYIKLYYTVPSLPTVSFSANGGTGEMATVENVAGEYQLPTCDFTAPENHLFKAWAIGSLEGAQKQPGETITVDADTTIYAIWEELPNGGENMATGVVIYTVDGENSFGLNSGSGLYLVNGEPAHSGNLGEGGCTAYFDVATATLTLKNYNGGSIYIPDALNNNINIKLVGENTITTNMQAGISSQNGIITITSSEGGKLSINVIGTGSASGIVSGYGPQTKGTIILKGNANVSVHVTNNSSVEYSYGIYARKNIEILENASFTAIMDGTITSNDHSAGLFVEATNEGQIIINTTGDISIDTTGCAANYTVPVNNSTNASGSLVLTKVGTMSLKYKKWYNYSRECVPEKWTYAENAFARRQLDDGSIITVVYKFGTPYTVKVSTGKYDNGDEVFASTMQFVAGETVVVTAPVLESGFDFKNWTSASSIEFVGGTNANSNVAKFVMGEGDITVKANYTVFITQPIFSVTGTIENSTDPIGAIPYEIANGITPDYAYIVSSTGFMYGFGGDECDVFVNGITPDAEYVNIFSAKYKMLEAGSYRVAVQIENIWFYSDVFEVNYEIGEIPEATNVYVNGYPFATGTLYYKNGETETTADSSDWNAYYNLTKGELVLKDFEGTSISLGGALATNLKIKLIGTNTITASLSAAIYVTNNGNLTITADDDATLTINVTNGGNVVGISVGYSGSATAGTLTISGNANVELTVNSTSDSASAYGIYVRENVVIEDYASLKVVAKSNSTYGGISAGSGIYSESGNIEINTNEIVVSDASALGSTSYAMYAGDTPILTKAGSLILKWKGDFNCGPVNKDTIFDENGTINHAKNKDFENNVCSYVYGTPHYVTVFNGVAVVEDKNGETVCEINGGGYFVEGAVVTVKADATRNGHDFDSWISKSTVADKTLLETSVTVGDDDLILYANYDIFTVQPTLIKEGSNFYVTATLKASDISGFIVNENNLVLKSGEVDGVNAYVGNTENKVQVWDSTVPAGTYRYVVRYNGLNYYSDVFEVNYEIGELGDAPVILSVGGSEVDPETNMGGAPLIMIGQPYSAQVVATGNGLTYSAGVEDYMNLPAGLTINAETGLITGDCTVEIGTYNVSITVTNEWGSASAIILFIVADENCIPQIETEAGSLGTAYVDAISQFIVSAVDNSADFSIYNFGWTLKSGALPTGMSLTYTNSRTVYISGTPTEAGTFTFELEARNDVGFASRTFSITVEEGSVAPSLPVGGASLDDAVVGKAFQYQILATGTNTNEDPILFSTDNEDFGQESYDLGNGLSLSRTGLISGTPLAGGQVSFFVYAKNSAGIDSESYYVTVHENGEATSIAITPSVTVVAKGGSKEFTISLEGFGDVEQVAYWSFYMWDNDLGSAFPQPTDSTLSVNPSTPSGTVTLTVGENEERGQIRVVAYSKPGNNGIKTYATVTIVEKEDVIYTVSFSANGGAGAMASIPVVENDNYTLPESTFTAPVGHQFKGWSVNGVEKAVGDQITVSADVEIMAVWKANAYTITFDTKDGSAVDPITQDYGTTIVAPADPTRVGYTFAGWDVAIPATMPAENMTINATWEINQYTITFDTNGGNAIDPITLNYGVSVVAPADPTRVGYTFDGWDKEIPATMPAEDITITATWEVNQYTIVFDTKGGSVIAPITQDYGTTVVAPANPTKDGFVFTGWDVAIPATMPAENMTINATWVEEIPDTYTVTYTDGVDDEVVFADQIIANLASGTATPSFEGTPSRDGYTFNGWTPEVADTVTESVIYTATWTLIPVHSHTDADGKWESDGTNHWHTCSCGEEFDKTACSGGEATCTEKAICSTCGNAYGSLKAHDFGTEWKNDENNHWKECACGEKSEQGAHADADENGACDTCGRELSQETPEIKPDEPEKDGLSGGAIAGIAVAGVAVAGIGGFAIFWFVFKKKTIADLIAIFKKK